MHSTAHQELRCGRGAMCMRKGLLRGRKWKQLVAGPWDGTAVPRACALCEESRPISHGGALSATGMGANIVLCDFYMSIKGANAYYKAKRQLARVCARGCVCTRAE